MPVQYVNIHNEVDHDLSDSARNARALTDSTSREESVHSLEILGANTSNMEHFSAETGPDNASWVRISRYMMATLTLIYLIWKPPVLKQWIRSCIIEL